MPTESPNSSMSAGEWGLLLALSALWGSSFFFFKVLVAALPPLTVVLGRVGFAALALNVFLLARGQSLPREPRLWLALAAMGLVNNVIPFTLIVFGETRISSGLASIINATTPVFAVLAAHILTKDEKLNRGKMLGVVFGFGGVAALVGPQALQQMGRGDLTGELACLAAALSYAVAGIFGRRFRTLPALIVATGQITASTLILIPIALVIDRPWLLPTPPIHIWLAFAGIALLCTTLAYILYFRILATAGATNLMLVTFLLPVSAMGLGILALGETAGLRELAGLALIGLGLVCIDGRALRMFGAR